MRFSAPEFGAPVTSFSRKSREFLRDETLCALDSGQSNLVSQSFAGSDYSDPAQRTMAGKRAVLERSGRAISARQSRAAASSGGLEYLRDEIDAES